MPCAYNAGMKIAHHRAVTVDEFVAWSERQDRCRFELFDGEIVMQSERAEQWEAKAAIWSALNGAIKRAGSNCHAVPDGATVRISDDTAFDPGALVYCGEKVSRKALEVPNPIIVVEVLSEATASYYMGYKRRGYFNLPIPTSASSYIISAAASRSRCPH